MSKESSPRIEFQPGDVLELSADEFPQLERDIAMQVYSGITDEQLEAVARLPLLPPQIDQRYALEQPPRFRATFLSDPLEQLRQARAGNIKFSRGNGNTPPDRVSEDPVAQATFVCVLLEATESVTRRLKGVAEPVTYFPAAMVWYGIEPGAQRHEHLAIQGVPTVDSASPAGSKVGRGTPLRRYVAQLHFRPELQQVPPMARYLGYKMLQLTELTGGNG